MNYSNCHQHPGTGRQLEFIMAQHSRPAGDNTGVRWADFTTDRAPTGGYYTSNSDTNITETDNLPCAYLPWDDAAWAAGMKIVKNISTRPTFLYRGRYNNLVPFYTLHQLELETGVSATDYQDNYNPACLVNPASDATWTCFLGGGVGNNYPNRRLPTIKVIKKNPNYPGSSSLPYILKVMKMRQGTGYAGPTHMRHAVKIGNWIYWGGGGVNTTGSGTGILNLNYQFYRVYIPDLVSGVFTQERITDATPISSRDGISDIAFLVRSNLLCADEIRKWLIYINSDGVWRYKVPASDGNNGTWGGPCTFGYPDWASAISDGLMDTVSKWQGLIGTHRSDLQQTFFRYNTSRRWNRINWGYG
jgi:hypothetical protein